MDRLIQSAQGLFVKGNLVHCGIRAGVKGWRHYKRHTCPLAIPPLVYHGEQAKERSRGGGDAWSRFSFSSRELIKEAVHLPLKFHPLATQPCIDVGCGNIC